MKRNIATLISRIFEPIITFSALIIWVASISVPAQQLVYFFFTLGFIMSIPVLFMIFAMKKKWISNWDIHKRKERIVPLILMLFFTLVVRLVVGLFGASLLTNLFTISFVWLVGFFLVTLFFKISGHAGVNALVSGLIVSWFGWNFWPVLLVVPAVAWARVVRKDHTVAQVIAGALYSWGIVFVLRYFTR